MEKENREKKALIPVALILLLPLSGCISGSDKSRYSKIGRESDLHPNLLLDKHRSFSVSHYKPDLLNASSDPEFFGKNITTWQMENGVGGLRELKATRCHGTVSRPDLPFLPQTSVPWRIFPHLIIMQQRQKYAF